MTPLATPPGLGGGGGVDSVLMPPNPQPPAICQTRGGGLGGGQGVLGGAQGGGVHST